MCNAIIRVKDVKVVQFKTKFHYIIPGRKFFTPKGKKEDKIRVKNKSLMLRKIKITIIKILIENLFISEYFQ